jgi:tetratricopeptide (TPR) repeat protein
MAGNKTVFQEALRRAHNYAWDRKWPQAIVEYRRAAAEFDTDPLLWISLGVALVEARRPSEAREAYDHASALRPDDITLQQKIAELCEQTGDKENALRMYLNVATAQEKGGTPARAIDAWNAILRLQPLHLESRAHIADLMERLERTTEAAQENVALARLLLERGKSEEATARARRALQLDVHNADARDFIESFAAPSLPAATSAPARPGRLVGRESGPAYDALQAAMRQIAETVLEHAGIARGADLEQHSFLTRAVEHQSRHQVRQAIELYGRALAAGAELPEIHYNLGMLLLESLQLKEAIAEFNQSVQSPQLVVASEFALGCCYATLEVGQALDHLLAACGYIDTAAAKPEQAERLAQLYHELTERCRTYGSDEAVGQLDSLIEFLSGATWQAKVAQLRGRLDTVAAGGEVLTIAEVIIARHADEMLDALLTSQSLLKRQLHAAAAEECYRGIALAPTYLPLHAQLAEVYVSQGRVDAAVNKFAAMAGLHRVRGVMQRVSENLQRILAYTPENQAVRAELIEQLMARGDFAAAIDQHFAAAEIYLRESMSDAALNSCQAAMQLIPRGGPDRWTTACLHLMGEIYMQRTAWKEALQCYQHIRLVEPDDVKACLRLVDIYFKLGRNAETIDELDHLGGLYERTGETEQLVPVVGDMAAMQPQNAALRNYLIDLLVRVGRQPQAIAELDALGEIQLNSGQPRQAIRTVERIITLEPANAEDYRELLAQLQKSL